MATPMARADVFLGAMLVAAACGCREATGEHAGTTSVTASRTWAGAHAEPFSPSAKSARVGEILWPAQVHRGPPPLVVLVAGPRATTLALRLAGSGVATLRYADGQPVDAAVVSSSVAALRRDARVGRIVLVATAEHAERLGDTRADAEVIVPGGASSNDVLGALSKHLSE
jgi:hypothetical protein